MSEAIPGDTNEAIPETREENTGPAPVHERELVELLLAEPALMSRAVVEISLEELEHPRSRKVVEALYRLHASGRRADLDQLREPLDNERLWSQLHILQERGENYPDRPGMYEKVVKRFRERQEQRRKQAIKNQIHSADPDTMLDLLRKLKENT